VSSCWNPAPQRPPRRRPSSIVGGAGALSADSIRENRLNVFGTAHINPNGTPAGVSHLKSLTIDGTTNNWSGKLDLTNNALVLDYDGASPIATIANQIKSGFGNGDWLGKGITSSLASSTAAHPTALGYAEASDVGFTTSFLGQPSDTTSVLIRYVYSGDANLDGTVNALDFNAVATNFGGGGRLWNQGDFNFDGATNTSDFTVLSQNFGQLLPAPTLGAVVPEPGILLAIYPLLLARRQKAPKTEKLIPAGRRPRGFCPTSCRFLPPAHACGGL
jgi:hypothetical protein